jgi:hypothetical protein
MYVIGRYISALSPLYIKKFEKDIEAKRTKDSGEKEKIADEIE